LASEELLSIMCLKSKKVKVSEWVRRCYPYLSPNLNMEGIDMRNTSDMIEHYLKKLLQDSPDSIVELQRNELADQFQCVPSQINYVISTRFTLDKGYVVESKRGGGGYVRIRKVDLGVHEKIHVQVSQTIGVEIDQSAAEGLIYRLEEAKLVSCREANLLRAAMHRETIALKLPLRDEVRARLLKAMLIALLSK
jgi:transcriptional regulator of stress and heat shock response